MSGIFGETLSYPQENGPDVELVVFGDEFYSRRETKNGYTTIYDDKLGQYCYAILIEGQFASSGIPISKPPPQGLQSHLEETESVRRDKFNRRYNKLRPAENDTSPDSKP